MNYTVITTFPDAAWDIYAEKMLKSMASYWTDNPILVQLDTNKYHSAASQILRPNDAVASGMEGEHKKFVERNSDKDDPTNYRKQAVRFCHKIFAIKRALSCVRAAKKDGEETPRYLIWIDADVLITRKVTDEDVAKCLPKDGDAVSYLGRKDWDHSECGWMAFDLDNGGDFLIELMVNEYITDAIFDKNQWHDSWLFDLIRKDMEANGNKFTNLTEDKAGMDIWPKSPMADWSDHYKGPIAKGDLSNQGKMKKQNLVIQTKNSLPDEKLKSNIEINQTKIKNWITTCKKTDEQIIVVSAGPMLVPEDLYVEIAQNKKIVAVKHALEPLKNAGIKPWACILLDPRDHVNAFVQEPDKDILYFVASQVDPVVVDTLLDAGCTIWGYHAAVGAGEGDLTNKQSDSIVSGGSATATRGLYVLNKLGFHKFKLYGYDLCLPNKPEMNDKDEFGQPKYFEAPIQSHHEFYKETRTFWSKAELLAQAQEMIGIIQNNGWDFDAVGSGIVPFMVNGKKINNLRLGIKKPKMSKQTSYEDLIGCRKTILLILWDKLLHKILRIRRKVHLL